MSCIPVCGCYQVTNASFPPKHVHNGQAQAQHMPIKRLSADTVKILQAQKYVFDYTKILKELVENSLDAKATRIIISISKDIEVCDNGTGMVSEIDYFKTNKETELVLSGTLTDYYGYKGIFLSSVRDICDLVIITKTKEEKLARCIDYKRGTVEKVAREDGTTVRISNLFKNSPIRRGALKLKVSEILRMLEDFLVFQAVFVRLVVNNRKVFERHGTELPQFVLENNLRAVCSQSFDFFYNLDRFKNPLILAGKRIITNKKLVKRLKTTLSLFFKDKIFYVLQLKNIQIDILSIDKLEVLLDDDLIDDVISTLELKFSDTRLFEQSNKMFNGSSREIFESSQKPEKEVKIHKKLRTNAAETENKTLIWGDTLVNVFRPSTIEMRGEIMNDTVEIPFKTNSGDDKENVPAENLAIYDIFERMDVNVDKEIEVQKSDLKNVKIIGQFNQGFILATLNGYLMIFDQHAVDEIYNFEMIKKGIKFNKQSLLKPISLPSDSMLMSDDLSSPNRLDQAMLSSLNRSFEVKDDKITASPSFNKHLFNINDYRELVSTGEVSSLTNKIASKACRMSIMIGDKLNLCTMNRIIYNLSELDNPWNCPHGRPTFRVLYKL
ncbi:DNA mismatch repair protein - MLH2/PMS1/Pms2 family [Trachipleistophora hominis]|uniref:DNA mismatch repair protein-MLH2/PMS1/Pms2 family n=1 Tax=Trachipleistophora hominis TaxID=72359 RepID=L7JUF0_TRAHO|nr:DNA mismatch repair protein - MLH2/PMS1/Pms2 family [Trachipleistophora hominis]